MKNTFEQAYDNYLAGQDIDSTLTDCARFMFEAGVRAAQGRQEAVGFLCQGIFYAGNNEDKYCTQEHTPLYTTPPAAQAQIDINQLLQAIARGWCHERNKHKVMDTDLAYAIAEQVEKLLQTPAAPDVRELVEQLQRMVDFVTTGLEVKEDHPYVEMASAALAKHGGV